MLCFCGICRYNHYLVFKRLGKDKYHIKNFITEDEWEVSAFYAQFLKSLDGKTDPYEVFSEQLNDDDIDYILEEMAGEGFFDNDEGATSLGIGSAILPLWTPNITKGHRIMGALLLSSKLNTASSVTLKQVFYSA